MPGEDAKMYCVVDNKESKSKVERVSVTLVNEITYTSKEHRKKHFTTNILKNDFPGLEPGQDGEREQVVKIQNLNKRMNPLDIKPTARGSNLHSIYYLKV